LAQPPKTGVGATISRFTMIMEMLALKAKIKNRQPFTTEFLASHIEKR
jgi:hypothetical protein